MVNVSRADNVWAHGPCASSAREGRKHINTTEYFVRTVLEFGAYGR